MLRGSTTLRTHARHARSFSAAQPRLARVDFQLDYHLSSQFAGLAVAQHQGLYTKRGLEVSLLSPPPAGEEPALVTSMQEQRGSDAVVLGSVEQNTLIAAQLYGNQPIRAVSAMLHATPLAIATAPDRGISKLSDLKGMKIAAASDTEEIVRSALAHAAADLPDHVEILPVAREEKLRMFLSGEVEAFQVYTTTEALQLQHELGGTAPVLMPFGDEHGFAQVIFAHEQALECPVQRNITRAFLDATYDGWTRALREPEYAAELVVAARAKAGVSNQTAGEGDYSDTFEFQLASLQALAAFVQPTPSYEIGSLGVKRFMAAADVIASDLKKQQWFSSDAPTPPPQLLVPSMLMDTTLWPQPELMRTAGSANLTLDGQRLAERRFEQVKVRAERFQDVYGRQPRLVVVELESEVPNSLQDVNRKLASPNKFSWLDKQSAGEQANIAVEHVVLAACSSTDQVAAAVRKLNRREDVDGIMMELPDRLKWSDSLDANKLLAAVDGSKCVDAMSPNSIAALVSGAASATRCSLPSRPTTPASVMDLLEQAGVPLSGKHAVVIGNSRLCGQPTSLLLQKEGATVSITTSKTPKHVLDQLCLNADVIVSVVGEPGVLPAASTRPGATLINVGTCFDGTSLVPDIDLTSSTGAGRIVSAVPGGVGPNPVTVLLENVVHCAEKRAADTGRAQTDPKLLSSADVAQFANAAAWTVSEENGSVALRKAFQADSFQAAAMMVDSVAKVANELKHHPMVSIQPASDPDAAEPICFNHGCEVQFTLRSIDAGGVSDLDIELAKCIDEEL